ncbi:chaperone [Denitrovibrio acetiphilus DSM 12809]|uniref:Chaperone n=1 Tax=Denitrovibrio acetiphilus (strain DSM 12809 / NBRC 114555 / N2460) TaxID=522772 RepID=D4H1S1_DENA2|nr:chaperone [Denitrovibrio acetiphilus]ADD68831.1 chaperone [Denitrovibrio acetiphilus DSM 12809]
MKIFDQYSELLRYPSEKAVFSNGVDSLERAGTAHLKYYEFGNLQEEYVDSFDFSEKSSLMITVHLTEEEKERSNILAGFASFQKTYGGSCGNASPDYLPDLLNALQDAAGRTGGLNDACLMSGILLRAVEKIETALTRSGSVYLPVLCGLKEELCLFAENQEVSDA